PQGGDGTGWIGIFFSAAPASSVEMTAFDVGEDGLILEAYGAIDATDLLGSFIIDGTGRGFGDGEEDLMTLSGIGAIRSIVLKQVRDDPTRDGWVVDDMQFIFTPEPATAWLMGLGIFALGFARRRR
ncbi:MAG: PEP-CTERM sorting domain-containing protein, partial [Myxococcales bacterium]|nr:PEP-CTERM sorting domain-containing protein [Myxococcales bacterium]